MKKEITWLSAVVLLVRFLAAGLAAISADQLLGQPVASTLQRVGPLAALGSPLPPGSSASSLNLRGPRLPVKMASA